ncbi:MAG: DUF4266 domain-containing protein [Gammaproteobacteria bacterium]|nr:DUF4266 domain-containing protein [Gammaproteobacteria bacterium]
MKTRFLLLLGLLFTLCACAPIKPWERGILAQPTMQLVPDKMVSYGNDHIYFSKEGSTGGKGVGGGGCGCN